VIIKRKAQTASAATLNFAPAISRTSTPVKTSASQVRPSFSDESPTAAIAGPTMATTK
jgi:hypothetical protein